MKTTVILGAAFFLLCACGENSTYSSEDNGQTKTNETTENQEGDETTSGEDLAMNEADFDHSEFIGHQKYDPQKMKDWPARTYRSDGYRPSAASEWIKVIYTPDNEFINTVLYWNVNDETPIVMKLIESEFIEGEISGWSGKVKSPDGFFDYEFGIIEDQFNLIFDDEGRMQTFYQELE
jgi:hypothetical protein